MKPEDVLRTAAIIAIILILVLSAKTLLIGAAVAFGFAALGIPVPPVNLTALGLFLWVLAVLVG